MLDKVVTLYRQAKLGIISGLSGTEISTLDEAGFYDVGYMQSHINRIQRELKLITNKIETSIEVDKATDKVKKYRSELLFQREQLLLCMIFFASNSFNNLDDCMNMAKGHDFEFIDCIQGLQAYKQGNMDTAFKLLEAYYLKHGNVEEHFLVNKVFGLLLLRKGSYRKAIDFLTYALQFVPSDSECLNGLSECYSREKNIYRAAIINEVLAVLK